jgi:hypothetical protein
VLPNSEYSHDNPSPRFLQLDEQYRQLHELGLEREGETKPVFSGGSLLHHIAVVERLARETKARTVLDYGCGKALLYKEKDLTLPGGRVIPSVKEAWGMEEIRLYDPGVAEYSARPEECFDGVVSTDVLEHIPEEDIDWVLGDCFRMARRFVYMNIASYPAQKILPNGWNAHVTIKSPEWWRLRIEKIAQGWPGSAYIFDVEEKRTGGWGRLVRAVTGQRMKLTRQAWSEQA